MKKMTIMMFITALGMVSSAVVHAAPKVHKLTEQELKTVKPFLGDWGEYKTGYGCTDTDGMGITSIYLDKAILILAGYEVGFKVTDPIKKRSDGTLVLLGADGENDPDTKQTFVLKRKGDFLLINGEKHEPCKKRSW